MQTAVLSLLLNSSSLVSTHWQILLVRRIVPTLRFDNRPLGECQCHIHNFTLKICVPDSFNFCWFCHTMVHISKQNPQVLQA